MNMETSNSKVASKVGTKADSKPDSKAGGLQNLIQLEVELQR